MSVDFQASLFDTRQQATLGRLADTVQRTLLTRGAWVDLRPGWVSNSERVFEHLVGAVAWKAERRPMYDRVVDVPRLLAFYDEGEPLPDPVLTAARAALNDHYSGDHYSGGHYSGDHYSGELGDAFTTAGFCYYRDGRDSVAWHGDTIGRGRREDTQVAIVSLGHARRLRLRPKPENRPVGGSPEGREGGPSDGARTLDFLLGHGDLLVMGGSCQRTWEHAIPKTAKPVGPRISIQFRPRGVR